MEQECCTKTDYDDKLPNGEQNYHELFDPRCRAWVVPDGIYVPNQEISVPQNHEVESMKVPEYLSIGELYQPYHPCMDLSTSGNVDVKPMNLQYYTQSNQQHLIEDNENDPNLAKSWWEPSAVRRRNERERLRVRNVNSGFVQLRGKLPLTDKDRNRRLSKVEILRMAISYIRNLQNLAKNKEAAQNHSKCK